MAGDALFLPVEVYRIHYRMTGPTAECMPHRRTVTACHGSDGNKTYTTTAELFLKHFAQVGCKYIRFDKGVSEYGNAYLFVIKVI